MRDKTPQPPARCPRCDAELKVIPNHAESLGYGYCDHCQMWTRGTNK